MYSPVNVMASVLVAVRTKVPSVFNKAVPEDIVKGVFLIGGEIKPITVNT